MAVRAQVQTLLFLACLSMAAAASSVSLAKGKEALGAAKTHLHHTNRRLTQTVSCPQISGYTLTVGQDHAGDDISCVGGTDFNAAANACNSDGSCASFNVLPNNGFHCLKRATGSFIADSRVCFYTKKAISCPQLPGYSLSVGQDHGGDDIACNGGTDFNVAAAACSSDGSCAAFNVLPNHGFYCTKRVVSPLAVSSPVCFYTKSSVSCPQVSGYTLSVGQDHYGDDIACNGGTDFNTAAAACNSDGSCAAFNVLPNNGFFCTKRVAGPLAPASPVCFYKKNAGTSGSGGQIAGYWYKTWGGNQVPAGTNMGIAFSGWTNVANAVSESSAVYNSLPGTTKYIDLGGGGDTGRWSLSALNSVTAAINAGTFNGYAGIVYDVEEGDAGLADAFAASFAAAKAKGFKVLVTTSHSCPYNINNSNNADSAALMRSFFPNSNIDFLSPQLYTLGDEPANQYDIGSCGVQWSEWAAARASIIPSLAYASYYPAAQSFFHDQGVTTAGYIQWH